MDPEKPDPAPSGLPAIDWRQALLVPVAIAITVPFAENTRFDWLEAFSIALGVLSFLEIVIARRLGEKPVVTDLSRGGASEIPREAVSGFAAAMLILAIILGLIAFLRA